MKNKKKTSQYLLSFLISIIVSFCFVQFDLIAGEEDEWNKLIEQAKQYSEQNSYEQAVESAQQAAEYAEKMFGSEAPQTISSLYVLASIHSAFGSPEDALPAFETALKLAQKTLGENDQTTIAIMAGLGQLYGEQGQYEEAKSLFEKTLKFNREQLGSNDPKTLAAMISLAQMYQATGKFQDGEKLTLEAIDAYEKSLGAEHSDTLFAKEILASIYSSQDRFEQSLELYEEILEMRTETLGEKDQETLITMNSLAELYRKMENFEESESLLLKVISMLKEASGEDDTELYMAKGNLAMLYQIQGKYQKAEKIHLEVWEHDKKSLGEKHPSTIVSLSNVAEIHRLQGQYGKAEKEYSKSLELIQVVLGHNHPETIKMMNNMAQLFQNMGFFDKAEPLFKTALRLSKETLGAKHSTTLALMNNLASLFESQGVFKRSEPLYQKTILYNLEVYGPDHSNTVAAINNLAYLFLIQQRYKKAEPLFTRVYESWKNKYGEKHQKTLKAFNSLARVYHKVGKTAKAEIMFLDALQLRKETLGAQHPDVVRSMIDLSALYKTQKKISEAEILLLQTIDLSEKVLGEKHQYTFEAINILADLYEDSAQLEKALDIRKKGFDRRTEFFDTVLWAAGENTRQGYIELHKHEQDKFLALLMKMKTAKAARLALHSSLDRKGMLLKITSEIHKIMELTQSLDLADRAQELHDKRKQLASMTLAGPTTETPLEFKRTIIRLENELEDLQAEMGRASLIYHINSKPISVNNVFSNLEVNDVLVDYITYHDKTDKMMAIIAQTDPTNCFVWWECIGNKIDMVPLGDLESIRSAVSSYRETIQDEDSEEEDILESGKEIFAKVWKPLQPHFSNKTSIYIVPDSVLHLLPFDALVDENENFLIQSKDLKIMSSSRDLVVSNLPNAEGQFMILAGPDYDLDDAKVRKKKQLIAGKRSGLDRGLRISHGLRSLSFEPLLGAEAEGKVIQQVASKKDGASVMFIKSQAEEQQLRTMEKPPKMLHIATHGFFLKAEERLKKRLLSMQRGGVQTTPPPADNPLLRAGLAFAGVNSNAPFLGEIDTDNDGVLTAMEVLSLKLSGTQLVVLSACETGVGEIHAGEGVYGLRRAFQEAGVKSVVNSLWPVSDEGTRRLMTAFYKNIYRGMSPRKALRSAQLSLLDSEWNSPYYWSAFVLVERRFSANL